MLSAYKRDLLVRFVSLYFAIYSMHKIPTSRHFSCFALLFSRKQKYDLVNMTLFLLNSATAEDSLVIKVRKSFQTLRRKR